MNSVFHNPVSGSLWEHLAECWACGFDYDQAVSYSFTFTRRLFVVAMEAMDDDYDTYMYVNNRAEWRKGNSRWT